MQLRPVELHALEKTIEVSPIKLHTDPVWRKAFEIYNEQNDKKLSMSCRPCYMKVYKYFKSEVSN